MPLSVIIPTWNEAEGLAVTLAAVRHWHEGELVCADGGSGDDTVAIARSFGARVVGATRGRGAQLHAGAAAATGDIFWFLHADTMPLGDAPGQIAEALTDGRVVGGNFRLRFSGCSRPARFMTVLYPRLAWIGLRYGDSGIFARATAYAAVGGYRPYPLFEDIDFLRRLGRHGRLRTLPGPLLGSSRRFEGRPFAPVFARWAFLQVMYWLGWPPRRLARLYPAHQAGGSAAVQGAESGSADSCIAGRAAGGRRRNP